MSQLRDRPYLRRARIDWDAVDDRSSYPHNIPAISQATAIDFHPDVTFLVGENGSGKSTWIEAIAASMGFGAEGGTKNIHTQSTDDISSLADDLRCEKSHKRPRDAFFLRAESFYNVATYMDDVGAGPSLHRQSHGEAFLSILVDKLRGQGLYLIDEPEAALSPSRQLSALVAIHGLVRAESQFIIATNSPILTAYPSAKILELGDAGIREVAYEETENFRVTKDFLNRYPAMLKELLK